MLGAIRSDVQIDDITSALEEEAWKRELSRLNMTICLGLQVY